MIVTIMLIFIFLFSATNGLVGEVYAWDDCPKGLVNDEYPGICPRYIDTDENGICDHSEPAPEDRAEYQNPAEMTDQKQSSSSIVLSKKEELETTSNDIVFLSVLMPLIIIFGYAAINKIKQKKAP